MEAQDLVWIDEGHYLPSKYNGPLESDKLPINRQIYQPMFLLLPSPRLFLEYLDDEVPEELETLEPLTNHLVEPPPCESSSRDPSREATNHPQLLWKQEITDSSLR